MDTATLTPEWQFLESCPSCRQNDKDVVGRLASHNYVFGSRRIAPPRSGIALARCKKCGLVYKLAVPTPEFLRMITTLEQAALWRMPNYDFASEFAAIQAHHTGGPYDLLDVGAAGGELLRAAPYGKGRRSGLDLVRFDDLVVSGGGEFICAQIDSPYLNWSGKPYDVVTALDVLEHIYSPPAAMRNLRDVTKPGGVVIIETGDTDSISPGELSRWYYLAYFEHHLAWNARSITAIAERFGFDVVSIEQKRHKLLENETFDLKAFIKYHCFKLNPKIYHALQFWGGFDGSTPIKPNIKDHIRCILRRNHS
jgi:SAM-dependent methyltransferase